MSACGPSAKVPDVPQARGPGGAYTACLMASPELLLTPGQVRGAYLSGSSGQGQELGGSRACLSRAWQDDSDAFSLRADTGTETLS